MDKAAALAAIIQQLESEADTLGKTAETAYAMATDSETNAENKYDTRGLEASYLARGSAERASQLRVALTAFRGLHTRAFDDESAIGVGALIKVERVEDGDRRWFFFGPAGGGVTATLGDDRVTVVTKKAPMGAALLGQREGDEVLVAAGPRKTSWSIEQVS